MKLKLWIEFLKLELSYKFLFLINIAGGIILCYVLYQIIFKGVWSI